MNGKRFISFILLFTILITSIPLESFAGNLEKITGVNEIKDYDDVRGKDLSSLDLREQENLLFTLKFDTYTKWPDKIKMPKSFDPELIIEFGKNPGLHIRKLQKEGYTGRGVNIAYVDQPLLDGHNEYKDLNLHYEIIADKDENIYPSMHGPAVLSLLSGKDIGIVPYAKVYFMGTGQSLGDQKKEAAGFERIIEINRSLPKDEKIKIIGMSHRVADKKDGYYLKNSHLLRKAIEKAEKEGIMVIDCDTFDDPILLSVKADKDPDNYKNYTVATKYTSDNPKGKLCIPTSRTYAAGYIDDKDFYQYTQTGGQSWAVPYIVGVITMGLQINPDLTKKEAMSYLYKSGHDFKGGKIINPEGFIELVKKNCSNPRDVSLDKDYRYFLYNKDKLTAGDVKAIKEYINSFNDNTNNILKDVSQYKSAIEIYDDLKKASQGKRGDLKGIQIFGSSEDVAAFDIDFKVQMKNSIDESGAFKSDFFYSNFKSNSKDLKSDFSIYKAFDKKLEVSFIPEWPVSRLTLKSGEIAPYMKRNKEYQLKIKDKKFGDFVNFSNPIFPSNMHIDDMGYFIKERLDKQFNILDTSEYKLYGNQQGYYPLKTDLLGDFTRENIARENKDGIKEFIINSHGQWNNIDQCIFEGEGASTEKRISFLNKENINKILSDNYYDLNLWTCLNGYNLDRNNLVYEAMANGKCMSAIAASSIISNNGVKNNVSLSEMKQNNFFYLYYNYFYNMALGKGRSNSFHLAKEAYAREILNNTDKLLDGNYQFNLHNVLSYHYFGLLENWDYTPKENFSPKIKEEEHESFDGNISFDTRYFKGNFKVNSFKAERILDCIEFTLEYESTRNCDYSFFDPPSGDIIMKIEEKGIKAGKNTCKFKIGIDDFDKISNLENMTMKFGFDNQASYIFFNPQQLKSLE